MSLKFPPSPEPGIIADDLTGALDSGVQLTKWGFQPVVALGHDVGVSEGALVVSSDSRQVGADEAYRRARAAARRLAGRALYKKVDSTMRGHVGAEIDAVLDALGWERALVAPAYPVSGRTTVDGRHYVDGVLLSETPFARDPLCPMTESRLPALLAGQTRRRVGHLPLSVVEQSIDAVIAALDRHDSQIVVADATTQSHLRTLAVALARTESDWLPCGSAGLADEWPAALGCVRQEGDAFAWAWNARPVLVCAGSRHPTTVRQLEHARDQGRLTLLSLEPASSGNSRSLISDATSNLRAGRNVAITSAFASYVEGQGEAVAAQLGRVAARILSDFTVAGIILTGGDVARAVCDALEAEAIVIVGEVLAGVPAGLLVSGRLFDLRMVTKAGGFGNEDAILRSIEYIQGR